MAPTQGGPGDREGGIHDFDLVAFFSSCPGVRPFPPRRHREADFGPSRFGRDPDDKPHFVGRRVDMFGRSIEVRPGEPPVEAVRRYLRQGWTDSARLWAERPLVAVWPAEHLGEIIWTGRPSC